AQVWVDEGWVSHAVKIHAHDPESMAAWFQLGFGNRCIDAIKIVEQNQNQAHHLRIKKASKDDLEDLLDIKKDFGGYFESSPMFMKASLEDAKNNILDWLEKDNHHQWILYQKEALVGMIKIEPNGETLISRRDDTMNITGIYVKEAFRHMGLGKYLLDWLDNWLYKAGYRKCGVDYESFNIKGSNFWEKCFSPYTRTLSRRIDEEILEK
ncbi:MAG TPA: GNAT family N-acetyltransferase, partial [Candidatus Izemoplasmatales bacterium]|nr:GNAT family N-acetyltransferase [Candidatus Izemoplasmatales bacterium]